MAKFKIIFFVSSLNSLFLVNNLERFLRGLLRRFFVILGLGEFVYGELKVFGDTHCPFIQKGFYVKLSGNLK